LAELSCGRISIFLGFERHLTSHGVGANKLSAKIIKTLVCEKTTFQITRAL